MFNNGAYGQPGAVEDLTRETLEARYAGQLARIEAQRYPEDFDGIVVGAPVLDFSGTMALYALINQALTAAPLTPEKVRLLGRKVYESCDRTDGLEDGIIQPGEGVYCMSIRKL